MIVDAVKRDFFKKILSAENVYDVDIRTHYIKMPKSIYSYLNTKNKYEIFNFGLEEHIPIDELILADELIIHFKYLSKNSVEHIGFLLYINHYINDLNHEDIFVMLDELMRPFLSRLNNPFALRCLIYKKDALLNIIKQLGLHANNFFMRYKHENSHQYSFINLIDIFGILTKKHQEFSLLSYDGHSHYFEDAAAVDEFKADLPHYKQDDNIQYLLDHGFRFSHLDLYETFVSPELKKQIDVLRLLDTNHTDIISFLQNPIEKVDIQDMQII